MNRFSVTYRLPVEAALRAGRHGCATTEWSDSIGFGSSKQPQNLIAKTYEASSP